MYIVMYIIPVSKCAAPLQYLSSFLFLAASGILVRNITSVHSRSRGRYYEKEAGITGPTAEYQLVAWCTGLDY